MFTLNTHSRYLHGNFVSHAEALVATMPPSLNVMLATCSGSESNDLALRVAVTSNPHGVSPSPAAAATPTCRATLHKLGYRRLVVSLISVCELHVVVASSKAG